MDTTAENRKNEGLYKVFQENFPIPDTRNNFVLEFIDYYIDPPRYSIEECLERGLTYSVPLKAKLKLYCTDDEHEDFGVVVQDVYFGTIPYMTERGTFVIQQRDVRLHRPQEEAPVTTLLRAIGYETDQQILEIFDLAAEVTVNRAHLKKAVGRKLAARVLSTWVEDFVDEDTGEVVSIERNDVIIDRETVLEADDIDRIIDSGAKTSSCTRRMRRATTIPSYTTRYRKTPATPKRKRWFTYTDSCAIPNHPTRRRQGDVIDKLFFSDKRYDWAKWAVSG